MPIVANPAIKESEGTIANFDDFWPDFDLLDVREIVRLESDITTARLKSMLSTSILFVNDDLASWVDKQKSDGINSYNDLPSNDAINHRYKTAVYESLQAFVLDKYRDYDSTKTANDLASELASSIDSHKAEAIYQIRHIQGLSRNVCELI